MAQKRRSDHAPRPLDAAGLERAALRYVERYATTRAKLAAYLTRKLRERGWADETAPDVAGLAERLAGLGYVDDAAFAAQRTAGLLRRGYGARRIAASLSAAGVEGEPAGEAERREAALAFARRKRIGPFAEARADRAAREKALAAMLRAGHDFALAKMVIDAAPGDIPSWDDR